MINMRHHWLPSWLDGLCHQDTGRKMSWQTTMWKLSKDSTCCGSDTLKLTQGRHHSLRDMYYNSSRPKKRHLNVVTIYLFFLTESPNPLWNCCEGIICVDIYVLQKEIPNTLIFKWITFCLRKKSASVLLHYRNLHQSVRLFSSALHVSLSSLASKSSGLIYLSHTILVRLVSFISSVWFQ